MEQVGWDQQIENRLHWRRDVTLREDHCQVRKGEAPHVLAILNSFLLAVLDFLGSTMSPSRCASLMLSLCWLFASCLAPF